MICQAPTSDFFWNGFSVCVCGWVCLFFVTNNKYRTYKMMISSGQAKGLLSEYQSKYTSARAVYRERKKYCEEIDWNMLAVPPTGSYKVIFCFTSDALSGY